MITPNGSGAIDAIAAAIMREKILKIWKYRRLQQDWLSFNFRSSACAFYSSAVWKNRWGRSSSMNENLVLKNRLKEIRTEKKFSQSDLAQMVGVSRNTISSIETLQFCPTAKLALILCVALDKKFEDIFYFE